MKVFKIYELKGEPLSNRTQIFSQQSLNMAAKKMASKNIQIYYRITT